MDIAFCFFCCCCIPYCRSHTCQIFGCTASLNPPRLKMGIVNRALPNYVAELENGSEPSVRTVAEIDKRKLVTAEPTTNKCENEVIAVEEAANQVGNAVVAKEHGIKDDELRAKELAKKQKDTAKRREKGKEREKEKEKERSARSAKKASSIQTRDIPEGLFKLPSVVHGKDANTLALPSDPTGTKRKPEDGDTQVDTVKRQRPANAPMGVDHIFSFKYLVEGVLDREATAHLFLRIGGSSHGIPPVENLEEEELYKDLAHTTSRVSSSFLIRRLILGSL